MQAHPSSCTEWQQYCAGKNEERVGEGRRCVVERVGGV